MFDVFSKELPSSWEEPEVIKWKEDAKNQCKSYYIAFGGSQWHGYNAESDKQLVQAKICFAMFGKPTKEDFDGELIDAYTDEQKQKSSAILDKIMQLYMAGESHDLLVGMIFVFCKMGEDEFPIPLFAVCTSKDPTDPKARSYVDTNGRTYSDWQDWKDNNTLPMLKYCYPRNGFYTCSSSCRYEFDPDKEPDIEFGTSPQCNLSSRIFGTTDTVSAITSLGCGVIGIASMLTPLAPAVLITTAVCGGTSATYGAVRAVGRLVDKGQHSESMADLESMMLYFSIAATPLNFTAGWVNANLARGAQVQGRIFSSSTRMMATILNFSTLGVDSVLVGLGLANLIEKSKNDQLTTLDVVQFSMSVFFFTNTLIKPKMASAIIKQAQDQHIQAYSNSMSDDAAKATFDKFVDNNKGTGDIKDTSKIVRTINKIDNPDRVFGGLQNADKVMIGGRKGNTILVTDANQNTNRINPNKVLFTTEQLRAANFKPVNIKTKAFGGGNVDVEKIKVDGKEIFKGISNKEKARVNRVVNDAARNNKDVVQLALDICNSLQCSEIEQFLSVVEIVSADVQSDTRPPSDVVNNIRTNYNEFIDKIRRDITIAEQIASQRDVNFRDPLKAVYHYRKHGQEFVSKVNRQSVKVYLNKVPNQLITDYNLVEMTTNQDGTITKTYNTPDNRFAVVVENVDSQIIRTMYESHGSYHTFIERLTTAQEGWTRPNPLDTLPLIISDSMGFRGCTIQLILESGETFDMEP